MIECVAVSYSAPTFLQWRGAAMISATRAALAASSAARGSATRTGTALAGIVEARSAGIVVMR